MNQPNKNQTILSQVQVGMPVYDADNQKTGTVSDMFPGVSTGEPAEGINAAPVVDLKNTGEQHAADVVPGVPPSPASAVATFGTNHELPGFAFENEISEAVRTELIANGFLQLDRGGIKGIARYITPDQIAFVQDGSVHLNVSSDKLVKA